MFVRPGSRYRLLIQTADGQVVTGETVVPVGVPSPSIAGQPFNRDHDTLVVEWQPARYAKRYALRVESPYGPFFLFTDSTRFRFTGDLRNFFSDQLPRVFVPGFQQTLQVAAVDTNFFDYYRSTNDPFTGSGIINHLSGGVGMFGSYFALDTRSLEVVADVDEPIEGDYERVAGAPIVQSLKLFVDAEGGGVSLLTGNYVGATAGRAGAIGALQRSNISIAFLKQQSTVDTAFVLRGTVVGGEISGVIAGEGAVRLRKK
jgi:hypothetical protein